jgi:excisionase family DNA binding protein
MNTATTAQELLDDLQMLPKAERTKFWVLLGNQAFQDDNLTHEQVFGHLASEAFTVQEAAEYLEMSVSNFRRYVQAEKIKPVQIIGRNQLFATRELKALKRALKAAA